MPAAAPSFVDAIRALMNDRAVLVTQRIEIDSRVSLIDAQLAEVRHILGGGQSAAAPVPARAVEPPSEDVDDDEPDGLALLTEETIVAAIRTAGPIGIKPLAERMSVNHWTLRDRLSRLHTSGDVVYVGAGRGRRVALPDQAARFARTATARPDPCREDAAGVETRDVAVLQRIDGNGGVATVQELRRWFLKHPEINGGGSDEQQAEALKNALFRLKAKGKLSRTLDTWSTDVA